ncbi:MAG: tryptophan-rich sensory protein [Ruminococcus sp.]|nr:tryptophan-rich sensory protein [Ruminococcus sp.]
MKNLSKLFYLFLPLLGGFLVGFLIKNNIDYSELIKPFLAPPKIIFPIAWTIIYLLMGISYYILKKDNKTDDRLKIIYYGQLTINLFWSIIFFNLKLRGLAVFWIIGLDLLVIYMLYLFYSKNKVSFMCLI